MDKIKFIYHNKLTIFILLATSIYFFKVNFFPNELEIANKKLRRLSAAASFLATPNPVGIASRISTFKENINPEVSIDLTEYMRSKTNVEYNINDLANHASLYFKAFTTVDILFRNVSHINKRKFQLTVIVKGRTIEQSHDDAYNVLVTFDQKWKILKVQVLAPPQDTRTGPGND